MRRKDKKLLTRIILSAVLFALSFAGVMIDEIVGIALLFSAYLTVGYDVLFRAGRGVVSGQLFDENFLMAIATIGAVFTSQYSEAVFVMLFYQVGELFQSVAVGKSRREITKLMSLSPDVATVIRDGDAVTVFPDEISVGEIIEVRAGEKIALDGIVADGIGAIDTSALTGESVARDIAVGDKVLSGSVNLSGVLRIKTTATFGESTASKILELVENSAINKSKSEAFITRFSRFYTPTVVIFAMILAAVPPLILGMGDIALWREWVYRAMTFLVISCPCALVISVPLTFFGGIGCASRHGILIKGANYLEMLARCDTAVFDKTGTLTVGKLSVSEVCPVGISEKELLLLAAAAESKSNHPIAQAIVSYAGEIPPCHSHKESAGLGAYAVVDGKEIYAGSEGYLLQNGIKAEISPDKTAVHVACEERYVGCILLSDSIKPTAQTAVQKLKNDGIMTVMLTGDKQSVAESVAENVGIDKVYAGLLPADKVSVTESLIKNGRRVAFAGDGINDAPVLARADVGIAMGGIGSDAAIEAADVVIMDDAPEKIAHAMSLSRFTRKIVKQNITFVLVIKAVTLLLGALGLANMWMAVFADVGVAVIAILNAMRTLRK